jgi:hypothetical protein
MKTLAIVLVIVALVPALVIGQSAVPCGKDVTEQTLADAAALKTLETAGKVFLVEDFESAKWSDRFFDLHGFKEGRLTLETDKTLRRGKSSLRAALNKGKGATASMCYWFTPGYDKVHFRWYCRFDKGFDQGNLMHFSGLAGVSGNNRYAGMGKAGIRPTGFDRFTSRFEPWRAWGKNAAPGAMNFYSYFPTMKEDPKMKGKFWGNQFFPARRLIPERGEWHCFEIMIKANDPGKSNGEQAAWIDGKLYGYFTGIVWRKTEKVRIKRMNLGVYIHDNPKQNVVHFDDVALSTGYIGPIKRAH